MHFTFSCTASSTKTLVHVVCSCPTVHDEGAAGVTFQLPPEGRRVALRLSFRCLIILYRARS